MKEVLPLHRMKRMAKLRHIDKARNKAEKQGLLRAATQWKQPVQGLALQRTLATLYTGKHSYHKLPVDFSSYCPTGICIH